MNRLIIAAHGSRKKESNLEVAALAKALSSKLSHVVGQVEYAFLQFSQPLLADALDKLVAEGARHIIVFPFFIGRGSHIMLDIPDCVNTCREKYPDVSIEITPHLGSLPAVQDVIAGEVLSFLPQK